MDQGTQQGSAVTASMKRITNMTMVFETSSGLPVHVLKEYGQTRLAATRATFNRVEINNGDLECLQNLASGLDPAGNTNEKYEKIKQSFAK